MTEPEPLRLEEEETFYGAYAWSLNCYPRMGQVVEQLASEIDRLGSVQPGWRFDEVTLNVYLLACCIADTVDDFLVAPRLDFSKLTSRVPLSGAVLRPVENAVNRFAKLRNRERKRLERWRDEWDEAMEAYLGIWSARQDVQRHASRMSVMLRATFPDALATRRVRLPAAFRSQDMTHCDALTLTRKFRAAFPDLARPILVLGCRTAGSYLAPLVRGRLTRATYADVDCVTVRPKRGLTAREHVKIARIASKGGLVVVIDEPVNTGSTLVTTLAFLRARGVSVQNVVALIPVHPTRRDWSAGPDALALGSMKVITLEPEEWTKQRLLDSSQEITSVLEPYFTRNGRTIESVEKHTECNAYLRSLSDERFHSRLKSVYSVRLRLKGGGSETRLVLAKSVGWGWLSYSAFLAAERLSGFVTPTLGLRSGLLFSEWLETSAGHSSEAMPAVAARYIAARTRTLRLQDDPVPELARQGDHRGMADLARILSKAYRAPAGLLQRPRILRELEHMRCPVPTLIDGKMRPIEWVSDGASSRKSDFEQHGQGKTELSVADPAYDLADTILHWKFSASQEQDLLEQYVRTSGDSGVHSRLPLYKLLAGSASMERALDGLTLQTLRHRHEELDRQYTSAFDFLVEHTTRFCASAYAQPAKSAHRPGPVVVLDIDGVLDKQVFGFHSTTAAGMLAMSLLRAHGFPIVFNSARSMRQLRLYCDAYHAVGGVAEYGAVVWDADSGEERVLASQESAAQLHALKAAVRSVPGLFVHQDFDHMIKAYVYQNGVTVPVPRPIIEGLMSRLQLHRLELQQTFTDSAILPVEVNKGRGLREWLHLNGSTGVETIAVGDSTADLAMFQAASRSFAPGHIGCRAAAQALGCKVVGATYQPGFLDIVRRIVHPDGHTCEQCRACEASHAERQSLFLRMLGIADQARMKLAVRSVFHPSSLHVFRS